MSNSAIILQGQLRFFDNFFNGFDNVLNKLENKKYFFNFQNSSDIDKINYLELKYNPNTKFIEESKNVNFLISYFKIKNNIDCLPKHLLFQLYYWHTSFLMVEKYEKENNIKFDFYFRSRTDVVYLNNINTKIENNICYVPKNKYNFSDQICDFTILTKDFEIYKNISEIGFNIDNILESFISKGKKPDQFGDRADKSIGVYCSEQILFEFLNMKKIKTNSIFDIDLARHFK